MQITIEAATIEDMSYRLNELSAIFKSRAHLPPDPQAVAYGLMKPGSISKKQFPPELQQALVDSTPQIETKPVKKNTTPKPETKPAPDAAPTTKRGKEVTKEELQNLIQNLVNKKGMPTARAFLTSIKVDVLRNLPEDRYVDVYQALQTELK